VTGKNIVLFTIFAVCLSKPAFSEGAAKRMSLQASPVPYAADIVFLFMDNDAKTFVVRTDLEFQYALNRHFAVAIANALSFENYVNSYVQDDGGRRGEEYGKQFQCMFAPAVLYRPLGTWLKGWYISGSPALGWTYVSTKNLADGFTHFGFGVSSGYQWIFKNGFVIQAGGGVGKTWAIPFSGNRGEFEEWHFFNMPVDLSVTFRLGYAL
jgi:hypothetical protein